WHTVLAVRLTAEQAASETVDEVAGQVEIAPLPRLAVQLDQRGLDLRMAVDAVDRLSAVGRTEGRVDVVGETPGNGQQLLAAGGAVVCDSGLDQVAGAVQFVAPPQIGEGASALAGLEPGVEVSVGLLGVGDEADDALHIVGEPPALGAVRVQPGQLPGSG